MPLMYSYMVSLSSLFKHRRAFRLVFVPAGGIAPPFKHPLGAGYLLPVQFPGAVLEVIPGACVKAPGAGEEI